MKPVVNRKSSVKLVALGLSSALLQLPLHSLHLDYGHSWSVPNHQLPIIQEQALARALDWSSHNLLHDPHHAFAIRTSIAAVSRGMLGNDEGRNRINSAILQGFENKRIVVVDFNEGTVGVSVGENLAAGEVDPTLVREAMALARAPVEDGYRTLDVVKGLTRKGRFALVVPEPREASDSSATSEITPEINPDYALFYEKSEGEQAHYAIGHGGLGPDMKHPIPSGYMMYPLIAELMTHRARILGDTKEPQHFLGKVERIVRLLIRHELEHAQKKLAGEPSWENPFEVNEILSLLADLGIVKVPPTRFLPIENRERLENAYTSTWEASSRLVESGKLPHPQVDWEVHAISMVTGRNDFTTHLNRQLDGLSRELLELNPDLAAKFLVVPRGERHVSLFSPVRDWLGSAFDFSAMTKTQRRNIQSILDRYGPISIHLKGLNLGPDGTIFVEGHVDDNRLFELKKELADLFPDVFRRSHLLHITLARNVHGLTDNELSLIYQWIAQHRRMSLGTITVTRPYLRQTNTFFALTDISPERVEFSMGTDLQAPDLNRISRNEPLTIFLKQLYGRRYSAFGLAEDLATRILATIWTNADNPFKARKEIHTNVTRFADDPQWKAAYDRYKEQTKYVTTFGLIEPYLKALLDGSVVLDFGCGNMALGKEMAAARPGINVIGSDVIDYHEDHGLPNVRFIRQTEAGRLPPEISDESIDAITANAVLHHVSAASRNEFLSELWRVLKPGGRLILIEDTYSLERHLEGLENVDRPVTDHFIGLVKQYGESFARDFFSFNDWYSNILVHGVDQMPMAYEFNSIEEWSDIFTSWGFSLANQDVRHVGFPKLTFHKPDIGILVFRKPIRSAGPSSFTRERLSAQNNSTLRAA